jgi:ubiquitin-conjugating enzyme (huntingtin interacting protein 2)
MASNRSRRVAKEITDIHNDTQSHIIATPVGDGSDLMHLKGQFRGPPGTPYEGGIYMIDIKIPNDYPFRPPQMKFDTKVWHPNVSSQTVRYLITPLFSSYKANKAMMTGCHLLRHPFVGMVSRPHH